MIHTSALFMVLAIVSAVQGFTPDPNSIYVLKTSFQGPGKCLEGNRFATRSTLGGAAFMAPCTRPATGQLWKFVPQSNGYYKMKTVFQGDGKCLEGNRFAATSTLRGAAFMDNCQNVSGQLWKIVDRGNGYFTLTTMFRESSGECLEGNRFAPTSTLEGAAFMSTCRPFTGQLFKAEKFA